MITNVRSATIQQGVPVESAFEWAVKVAMYVNQTFGTNVQVQRNLTGPLYQVHWVNTLESLAQVEEIGQKLQADQGYASLLADAREQGLFVTASIEDHLYQSIP